MSVPYQTQVDSDSSSSQVDLTQSSSPAQLPISNGALDNSTEPANTAKPETVSITIHTSSQAKAKGLGVSNIQTSKEAMRRRPPTLDEQTIDIQANINDLATGAPAHSGPEQITNFQCPVGDRYVKHESRLESLAGRFIDHIAFRVLTMILIFIDLSIVISSVTISQTEDNDNPEVYAKLYSLNCVALAFSSYFMVEVGVRMFAQSPRIYCKQVVEIIDGCVVLLSFIVVIVDFIVDETATKYAKFIQAFRLVRLVRFVMLLRIAITQRRHLVRAARLMVSENKRRYRKDGFDLDLCFITDRVIAMSFPSQGIMSVYRNHIDEVSRFFKTKFSGQFRIYNCCSEREYDADKYFDNSVVKLMIDDHNVPPVQGMVDFAEDMQQWMDKDRSNVTAIHCKGGKGRTGTMICVWLLHSGAFTKAEDALDYFGSRRTDFSVSKKFQGVETPSQSRYVKYFEKIKYELDGQMPSAKRLKPSKISVAGLKGIGTGDGKDLIVKVIVKGDVIFEVRFGTNTNCTTIFERETYTITASLVNAPMLLGDVKVRFEALSNIPRDYDDCPWFFWFNTSFIENNELSLGREDLDNPHKPKSWKTYKEDFRVTMTFSEV